MYVHMIIHIWRYISDKMFNSCVHWLSDWPTYGVGLSGGHCKVGHLTFPCYHLVMWSFYASETNREVAGMMLVTIQWVMQPNQWLEEEHYIVRYRHWTCLEYLTAWSNFKCLSSNISHMCLSSISISYIYLIGPYSADTNSRNMDYCHLGPVLYGPPGNFIQRHIFFS